MGIIPIHYDTAEWTGNMGHGVSWFTFIEKNAMYYELDGNTVESAELAKSFREKWNYIAKAYCHSHGKDTLCMYPQDKLKHFFENLMNAGSDEFHLDVYSCQMGRKEWTVDGVKKEGSAYYLAQTLQNAYVTAPEGNIALHRPWEGSFGAGFDTEKKELALRV